MQTYSLRQPPAAYRVESLPTRYVLDNPIRHLLSAFRHLSLEELRATGFETLRALKKRGMRKKIWQFFYVMEAIILLRFMKSDHVHHLHVHFANNAAEIARLAVSISSDAHASWSLSIHGPGEFSNFASWEVASKVSSAKFTRCISRYSYEALQSSAPATDPSRFRIIRVGLPDEAFEFVEPSARRTSRNELKILFVGRLVAEKDPLTALNAAILLASTHPQHRIALTIIGDGPLRSACAELALRAPHNLEVNLRGSQFNTEIMVALGTTDVFCLPSTAEGLPVALMEAMARGVPVVSTAITAIPELVISGHSGILLQPGDVEALTNALADLMLNVELDNKLAVNAYHRVRELHTLRTNVRALYDLLMSTGPISAGHDQP